MKTKLPRSFASKSVIIFSVISAVVFFDDARAQMVGIAIPGNFAQPDAYNGNLNISADGRVLVGNTTINGEPKNYIIRDGIGEVIDPSAFLNESNFDKLYMSGISGDGSTVVGIMYTHNQQNFPTDEQGFFYKNGIFTALPTIGDVESNITSSSYDGSVLVGRITENGITRAIKFENNIITDLPSLGGNYSVSGAVSGDGSIIAGYGQNANNELVIFKYANGQMMELGGLSQNNYAYDISYDGSTIVGIHFDNGSFNSRAYKHTEAGGFVDLGTLGGDNVIINDVSATGKVIVGHSEILGNQSYHAYKFTDAGGMIDLGTLGGDNSTANSITPDGSVIVGFSETGNGDEVQIFMIRGEAEDAIPNTMVSVNNTVQVLAQNASQLNSVLNLKESLLNFSLNQDAKLFGKNGLHFAAGTRFASVDKSQETGGTLKFAYRLNENFRAGVFLDYGFSDDLPDNFKSSKNIPDTTIFATLGQNTDDSGLFLKLSASYNSANLDITRHAIVNTEAGKGRADLISKGAMTQLGYGFKLGNNFQITPYIGARFSEITRKSYQETENASFPISFNEAKKKSTTALIGSNFELKLSQNLNSRLALGIEKDLSASLDGYKGNIFYLGDFDLTPRKIKETRYSASAGLTYKITDTQEVSVDVNYIKQSLQGSNAVIGYVNYAIGF